MKVRLKAKTFSHIVVGYNDDGGEITKRISADSDAEILESVGENKYKVKFYTGGNPGIVIGLSVSSAKLEVNRIAHPEVASKPPNSSSGANASSRTGLRAGSSPGSKARSGASLNQESRFIKPKKSSKKKKKTAIVYPTAAEWIEAFEEDPSQIHKNGHILSEGNGDAGPNQKSTANNTENNPNSSEDGVVSGMDDVAGDDDANNNVNVISDNDGHAVSVSNTDDNADAVVEDAVAEDGPEGNEFFDVDAMDLEEDNLMDMAALADEMLHEEAQRTGDFYRKKSRSWSQIERLIELGYEVECKDGRKWRIVQNSDPEKEAQPDVDKDFIGLKGYKFERLVNRNPDDKYPLMDMFVMLWAGDWQKQRKNINDMISAHNIRLPKGNRKMGHVSEREFWQFFGIMILAGGLGCESSKDLWPPEKRDLIPPGFQSAQRSFSAFDANFSKSHFDRLRPFFARMFQDPKIKKEAWSEVRSAIDGFNLKRTKYVSASVLKVLDEIMCAWKPRKDAKGGLPHISFVARKPKPMGMVLLSNIVLKTTRPKTLFIFFPQEPSSRPSVALNLELCSTLSSKKERM